MSYLSALNQNQNRIPIIRRNRLLLSRPHSTLFQPFCNNRAMPFTLIGSGIFFTAVGIYLIKKLNSHPSGCVLRIVEDNSTALNKTFFFEPGCQNPYFISLFVNFIFLQVAFLCCIMVLLKQ